MSATTTDDIRAAIAGRHGNTKGWVRARCPRCIERKGTRDRHLSLGVNTRTGKWHCFRCRAKGYLRGAEFSREPEVDETPPEKLEAANLPDEFELIDKLRQSRATDAPYHYMRARGIDDRTIREAQIGAAFEGKYCGRVIVPIVGRDRKVQGWSARLWDNVVGLPKYLYPSGMDRYRTVYNEAAIYRDTSKPLFLVEGVFDALPHWPDALALLGKPSDGQVTKLLQAKRPLVVALDGDAWREAEMFCWRLQYEGMQNVSWVKLPPGEDPGTVDIVRLAKGA